MRHLSLAQNLARGLAVGLALAFGVLSPQLAAAQSPDPVSPADPAPAQDPVAQPDGPDAGDSDAADPGAADPGATEGAPSEDSVQAQAEIMLTGAVRLLAKGGVEAWLDGYCSGCTSSSTRERWRRYQLSTALRNAQYCLHGEAPGQVNVVRWKGDLRADGHAKAYLQCGGGQHGDAQEGRLPVPVTVVLESNGELRISQLAI
jgi:hypothetical protein